MSAQGAEATRSASSLSQLSLEYWAFIASGLFLIGAIISLYVAYESLKTSKRTFIPPL